MGISREKYGGEIISPIYVGHLFYYQGNTQRQSSRWHIGGGGSQGGTQGGAVGGVKCVWCVFS